MHRADPGGFARSLSYTAEGFVERVRLEAPGGLVDELVYAGHDALGNPGTLTSAERTTTLAYDAASRVDQVSSPGGESEVFDYDLRGNRRSHTTRAGDTWVYDYDAADQLLAITDPSAGLVASFAYDLRGDPDWRGGTSLRRCYSSGGSPARQGEIAPASSAPPRRFPWAHEQGSPVPWSRESHRS